jgi:hypothetical protein
MPANKLIPAMLTVYIAIACFTACARQVYDTDRIMNDFQTEGFLDSNHFQAVIRGTADPSSRGLVETRESSLRNARWKMESTVTGRLSEYCFNCRMQALGIKDRGEILNLAEAESSLNGSLIALYKKGHTAFEYYDRDCSAVIVYRIYGRNLQSRLEHMHIKIQLKKTDTNTKQ